MTEKVINFASSESNSSSESESPLAAADEYESGEYGAFKDDFDSGVNNFRPISPLRSSLHKVCIRTFLALLLNNYNLSDNFLFFSFFTLLFPFHFLRVTELWWGFVW